MADLSSSALENLYQTLLTLSTGNISGSLKQIQDGQGNATGLELSSTQARINELLLTIVAQSTADDGNVLSYDAVTQKVKRFSTNLISGYDSGWQNLDGYTASTREYGLPTITNLPSTPQYRILGRLVILRGTLCIPLDNGGGDPVLDYDNAYATQETAVNTSSSYGWTKENSTKRYRAISPRLLSSTVINPDANMRWQNVMAYRRIFGTAASGDPILMSASVDVEITTSGKINIISLKELEHGGDSFSANQVKNSLRRMVTTHANANDYDLDFTSYRTSTDGASTVNATWSAGDSTLQYPMNVYADDVDYLGGFLIDLSQFHFTISDSVSIAAIQELIA